ncbi:MAG: ATP-binding cassette domain-containing protein [Oceanococcaceae bacterium]
MTSLLQLTNVCKRYPPGTRVFKNVCATLGEGEFAWLTGRSGAGKSTLLKLIAGIERPSQGHIHVNGRDITMLSAVDIPAYRQHLGLIFQDPMLLMDRSVAANVGLSLDIRGGLRRAERDRRVARALARVGLDGRGDSHPAHLSGGEAARVAIARALVAGPRLVLADEPTGNLDAALAHDILGLFRQINGFGVSVIVASHDESLIASYPATRWHLQDHAVQVASVPGMPA